ncbi:MAG: hypothetical protein QOC82_2063, partial [Frankiaceae bacterium]|nr:hypothetical protein [Frankiaceae bacterium]
MSERPLWRPARAALLAAVAFGLLAGLAVIVFWQLFGGAVSRAGDVLFAPTGPAA